MLKITPEKILEEHIDFAKEVDLKKLNKVETRILFILYICESKFNIHEMTNKQIFDLINQKLRLKTSLQSVNIAIRRSKDKISSIKKNMIIYHKIMSPGIDEIKNILKLNTEKKVNDDIVPNEVVKSEKGYFNKVIRQINGCYQDGYYDACFVMIRRSIETLIIEIYEHLQKENSIKNSDGYYLMFSKLIDIIIEDPDIHLSRTSKTDLKTIKKLGDTAAHNRRLNLKKSDIDKYSDSIRLIIEELINIKL